MGISASKYDEIMRGYDERRMDADQRLSERKKEIYSKLNEVKAIDEEIADASVETAKLIISSAVSSDEMMKTLKQQIADLSQKKAEIISAAGYPSDYLQPLYTCPDCKDTGYIGHDKCHCLKSRIIEELYEQSHIKSVLEKENFTSFTYRYYNEAEKAFMEKVVGDAHAFIDAFNTQPHNMLFFGDTGCGKTFLSNCIAKELLDKGNSVIYFNAYQLFEILAQNTFKKDVDKGTARAFSEEILGCDLLVLDDLGSEAANSYTSSQLFLILNERLSREKATIISTNLNIQQLNDLYSERSISRILGNYNIYHFKGGDIRHRKRAAK